MCRELVSMWRALYRFSRISSLKQKYNYRWVRFWLEGTAVWPGSEENSENPAVKKKEPQGEPQKEGQDGQVMQ